MPRTRSASAHRKVLDATMALVADHGLDATSMDAIAQQSGVSKATIYKHWADKDALLLEMLAEMAGLKSRPAFDSGNTREDMVDVLAYKPAQDAILRERIMPHLVAYSARNVEFGSAWRGMVLEPPRQELTRLLRQGVERGELEAELNFELSLALLLGPMMYAFIFFGKRNAKCASPPDDGSHRRFAGGVVDAFWRAFGVSSTSPR